MADRRLVVSSSLRKPPPSFAQVDLDARKALLTAALPHSCSGCPAASEGRRSGPDEPPEPDEEGPPGKTLAAIHKYQEQVRCPDRAVIL